MQQRATKEPEGGSPQTPRGETPHGGKQPTGNSTRQHPPHRESSTKEGRGARLAEVGEDPRTSA